MQYTQQKNKLFLAYLYGGSVENQVKPEKLYYFLINNSEKIIESARYFEEVLLETEKPQAFVVTL